MASPRESPRDGEEEPAHRMTPARLFMAWRSIQVGGACRGAPVRRHPSKSPHTPTPAAGTLPDGVPALEQLHGMNASEETLAGAAGQVCCLVFAIQYLVLSFVHSHQLLEDSRYVNAADAPRPHESLALRWVRVIDAAAALGMSAYLVGLYLQLRSKSINSAGAKNSLLRLFAATSLVYVVASFIDFAQCMQVGRAFFHPPCPYFLVRPTSSSESARLPC